MGWKDWSYWLKGGLIGILISWLGVTFMLIIGSKWRLGRILRELDQWLIWGVILSVVLFTVGTLLGLIIGKIIAKKLSKLWIVFTILGFITLALLIPPITTFGSLLLLSFIPTLVFGFVSLKSPSTEPIFKSLVIGMILIMIELAGMFGYLIFFVESHYDLAGFGLTIYWIIVSFITMLISFIIGLVITINRKIKSRKQESFSPTVTRKP